jgi:hypothetical protein
MSFSFEYIRKSNDFDTSAFAKSHLGVIKNRRSVNSFSITYLLLFIFFKSARN